MTRPRSALVRSAVTKVPSGTSRVKVSSSRTSLASRVGNDLLNDVSTTSTARAWPSSTTRRGSASVAMSQRGEGGARCWSGDPRVRGSSKHLLVVTVWTADYAQGKWQTLRNGQDLCRVGAVAAEGDTAGSPVGRRRWVVSRAPQGRRG